jgi:hypothetical protein
MITIQQTVDIPVDRRLYLELPKSIPSGKATVALVFASAEVEAPVSPQKHYHSPLGLEEAKAVIAERIRRRENGEVFEDSARKYAGCLKGKKIFKGDPVEIQRKMRNEWD